MEHPETVEPASSPVSDSAAMDELAAVIGKLLESEMAAEAVVRFSRLRPPDQADVTARLPRESRANLLSWLTPRSLAAIIGELGPTEAVDVSMGLGPGRLSRVLDETSPDVAADILRGLPEEAAASVLGGMKDPEDVAPLLQYEDDAAGGLMTPEFIALGEEMTVAQAMAFVRRGGRELDPDDVSHLFVVDHDGVFRGTIDLARLVLGLPTQHISLLIRPESAFSVSADTDQEQCARLMGRYNLRRLAVADDAGKLVGVLKLEDMIDVLEDEATEDMFRMIGVGGEEKALGPFWASVRGRLPWLYVNLGTAILAGLVITLFESTLGRAVALAVFLPVIAGQGGIAGTQTLILMVRSIALGEIGPGNMRRLLMKEIGLGLVHGAALGLVIGVVALVWKGSEYLALIVAVAMLCNMVVAGVSGVVVPLGLRALRIDPALASAVAVTTATDVLGFLVYLGLASAFIGLITRTL
ncbi:MAG: magnesium transporter [Chloroflexi bacterium]|nr:magnesium transporter [Chloroflexota bacterium]